MERLAMRPEFEGVVVTNRPYVLIDDVTSMGGTLAELANYIPVQCGCIGI
jgi:adenine/guanine phosphoribosyltransferase-like PRPP-binding protein